MAKRREGKQIIPAKKSTKQPTSEGLTEERLKLGDDILSIVAAYGSEVLTRRDAGKGLPRLTAGARDEIIALLSSYSSPQEVKEQVKQARRKIAEWGNERCKNEKHIAERHGMKISMSYPRKRECFVCWQLLLEKEAGK